MLTFSQNEIDLTDATNSEGERPADMSEVSLGELFHPRLALPRDVPKWIAEAHKRLASPLASISYALVALVSVLTGPFQRHGGFLRPLGSGLAVVLLVALGLTIDGLAARDNALISLIWVRTLLPGIVCAILLFAPARWPTTRNHTLGTADQRADWSRLRVTLTITLSRYIARQFLTAVAAAWVLLSLLVAMFDFLELLRRSVSKPDATFTLVGEIAALRLPYIMMQILPFAVLLGGTAVLLAADPNVRADRCSCRGNFRLGIPVRSHRSAPCFWARLQRRGSVRCRQRCWRGRRRWRTSTSKPAAVRWH